MVDSRLPLLRGRITSVDTYQAPGPGRGKPPRLPSLNPRDHAAKLLSQLDAIRATIKARSGSARDELATREIIAVHPLPGADLTPTQLDDAQEAWLVGQVPETGAVLLDVASGDLGYLRKKIEAFELAPPAVRDMKLVDAVTSIDLKSFSLQAPSDDAENPDCR
jgi:hypothetical protein